MLENIIIWLVVGGVAGWLGSLVVRGTGQGLLVNVVVGIVGAVIAGWLFGAGINEAITITTFIYSVIGAIILLAIINLINRGRVAR
jgi:uncharacterized membrane protein YeaQ/YmgE (transglycosylase-associated protein family)